MTSISERPKVHQIDHLDDRFAVMIPAIPMTDNEPTRDDGLLESLMPLVSLSIAPLIQVGAPMSLVVSAYTCHSRRLLLCCGGEQMFVEHSAPTGGAIGCA
jgi:hypothetical protein